MCSQKRKKGMPMAFEVLRHRDWWCAKVQNKKESKEYVTRKMKKGMPTALRFCSTTWRPRNMKPKWRALASRNFSTRLNTTATGTPFVWAWDTAWRSAQLSLERWSLDIQYTTGPFLFPLLPGCKTFILPAKAYTTSNKGTDQLSWLQIIFWLLQKCKLVPFEMLLKSVSKIKARSKRHFATEQEKMGGRTNCYV